MPSHAIFARCPVAAGKLLIGDEWVDGAKSAQVLDKYTGATFATIAVADEAQTTAAVASARSAFEGTAIEPYERYRILMRAADIVEAGREAFVSTIVSETGFTVSDASGDFDRSLQTLRTSAEEAKRVTGEVVPLHGAPGQSNRLAFTIRVPVGVVCAITPFNSPLNTVCHKVAPAIAAGNTVVLKPATYTPMTSVLLCGVLLDAGLPPGWLNMVTGGGRDVGRWLLENQDVDYYTFTGSTGVGRVIQQHAGLRRTQLELGNISGTIVCADADLDYAIPRCVNSSFRKAGQVCTSVQRLFVERKILEHFTGCLADAASKLKVGDPKLPETNVGPMIDLAEAERAETWVREASSQGAELALGGEREGPLLWPSILTNVGVEMKVMCQEIFAPVISIAPFEDLEDAIDKVNGTPFGLAAGIFTSDLNAGLQAARHVRVGSFHINDTSSSRVDLMPYGGVKDSGFGREGPKYAIHDMTEERLITITPTR